MGQPPSVEGTRTGHLWGRLVQGLGSLSKILDFRLVPLDRKAGQGLPARSRRYEPGTDDPDQVTLVELLPGSHHPGELQPDELRAWLYQTMLQNRIEHDRKRPPFDPTGACSERLIPPEAAVCAKLGQLANAIGALPLTERRVIVWRYWERLEYEEIGQRLGGWSTNAARKLHFNACRNLLKIIGTPLS